MKLYFVLFLILFSKLKFERIDGREVRIIRYDLNTAEDFIFIKMDEVLQYCFNDSGYLSTTEFTIKIWKDEIVGSEVVLKNIDENNIMEDICVFKTVKYDRKMMCVSFNSVKREYDRFKVKVTVAKSEKDKDIFLFPGIIVDYSPTITCRFMEVTNDNEIVKHGCLIVSAEKASININAEKQPSSIECRFADDKIEKKLKASKYICSSPFSREDKKIFITVKNYNKITDLNSLLKIDEETISNTELAIENSRIAKELAKTREMNLKKKRNESQSDERKYSSVLPWMYVGAIPAILFFLISLGYFLSAIKISFSCFIDRKYIHRRQNYMKEDFQLSKLQAQALYVIPSNAKYEEAKKYCTSKPIFNNPVKESAKYSTSKPIAEVMEDKKGKYCTTSRVF